MTGARSTREREHSRVSSPLSTVCQLVRGKLGVKVGCAIYRDIVIDTRKRKRRSDNPPLASLRTSLISPPSIDAERAAGSHAAHPAEADDRARGGARRRGLRRLE